MKLGVTISTSWTLAEATTDSQSVEACCQPQLSANSCGFSAANPQTVCITGLIGGSKNLPKAICFRQASRAHKALTDQANVNRLI